MYRRSIRTNLRYLALLTILINCFAYPLKASSIESGGIEADVPIKDSAEAQRREQALETIDQLAEIHVSLKQKHTQLAGLQKNAKQATGAPREEIEAEIRVVLADIEMLEKSFDQIAIGGIDLSVFGVEEKKFDWREELVSVVKPLIENLKSLTEKPRKIENLRRIIADKTQALDAAENAKTSIQRLIDENDNKQLLEKLRSTQDDWEYRAEEIEREIQLAQFQLDNLEQKNVPLVRVIKEGIAEFIDGRGLTILILILAISTTLLLMRGILWVIRKRVSGAKDRSEKTHYRLAAYGYRMLTGLLIIVVILIVLYSRQDVLLLAVTFVVLFGLLLALKNLLPKYITESKILLNMGGIRERERVIYNGIPWKVSALNVHSRFINPELRGLVRVPIGQMHDMISRPDVGDSWFPSSEGDWVIGTDGNPEKVIRQSVDYVELQDLNSVCYQLPTAEFYAKGMPNISRAEKFRIAIRFGIDYSTQALNPSDVEREFVNGLKRVFDETEIGKHVIELDADFDSAGDSSLNYLILATFRSDGAEYYNKIKRKIHRACVGVCTDNEWPIPFPQITLSMQEGSEGMILNDRD